MTILPGFTELKSPLSEADILGNHKNVVLGEDGKWIKKAILKLDSYIDNTQYFHSLQPFFYDQIGIFWVWNNQEKKYVKTDETDIMRLIDSVLGFDGQTISSMIKSNYLEAFKRVGRDKMPKEAPIKWVQFKDKAYSIESSKIYDVTPDYFFTNPIPWKLGSSEDTPIIDKLIEDWVGVEYKQSMYEIIAYCCYRDYPIHTVFCLIGCGRNGKSRFLALLSKFVGRSNTTSTELDTVLDSRFESTKLYKKLVCIMGETNFGQLSKTSLLKKLTGQDLVGFEFKNKQPFDDVNYAKILIASNSLPTSFDTSEGFYRRWMIINFNNTFHEGKDVLLQIPDTEYENLALKVCNILKKLIKNGEFTNQGDIEERKKKYILASNPLSLFISLHCSKEQEAFVTFGELYTHYVTYLNQNKKRKVSYKEFKGALEDEGYFIERTTKKVLCDNEYTFKSDRWVNGLKLNYDSYDSYDSLSTLLPIWGKDTNIGHNSHNCHKKEGHYDVMTLVPSATEVKSNNYDSYDDMTKKSKSEEEVNNQLSDETLLTFIEERGSEGYEELAFVNKFGEKRLQHLIETGQVYRPTPCFIKVLK